MEYCESDFELLYGSIVRYYKDELDCKDYKEDGMKEKLLALIKEHTLAGTYQMNNAMDLGKQLGLSRNWISQHLNEFYSDGTFIKINTRPVIFLDRETLMELYSIDHCPAMLTSLEELKVLIHTNDRHDFQKLIGQEGSLREIVDKCKASLMYPPFGLPTLLYGPTGTGKSTIVDVMYEYGINQGVLDKEANYIHVNCSEYANNPELITANLFGYKKGAFTGADSDQVGMIEAADKGMLFLDEVHCLKPECQEKLLLFMDHGNYRKLGDNEHVYHSDVRLIFATTQDPEQALLKTLLRRIPVRIHIPSLEERGRKEKSSIIAEAFHQESKKMKKEICISNTAYHALLNAQYHGNIGEVFNVVQTACMNALFHNREQDKLEIHTLNLPESIISNFRVDRNSILFDSHQLLRLESLTKHASQDMPLIQLFHKLLNHLKELQNHHILMEKFMEDSTMSVENYINTYLFDGNHMQSTRSTFIINAMKTIVTMVSEPYGLTFQTNEIYAMSLLIKDCAASHMDIQDFLDTYDEECENFVKIIENKFVREYAIVKEIMEVLKVQLDIEIQSFIMACFTLIMHIYHGDKDINRHIAVILSHGYATASSMANAVNQLLDQYIFDAIDMPLDMSTEAILEKLNDFLKKRGKFHDLILLVDMGSLEDIYTGLTNQYDVNIAIANHVNTKLALMVGEGLKQNRRVRDIFDECQSYSESSFKIIEREEKEKVILCSCATGIGTAEKLKDILEDSLPKSIPVKVLTYDYSTLLQNKLEDDYFDHYEVICIVGTLNPNIEHIRFIPVEELIMNDSFEVLTAHFQELINADDMEEFRKNILKNFSLSNIIGNLTILNPAKLLEHVADAIDRLQREMNRTFSYNVCFGLYVHVCCLIERLVTHDGADEYCKKVEDCEERFQQFVACIKHAFSNVEKYYKVKLPIEEIEYIDIYISNIQ